MAFIEASFLISIREDKDVGNGKRHSIDCWSRFKTKLFEEFYGFTIAPGEYYGCYTDPDTQAMVSDRSRLFIVALPEADVRRLRQFLKKEAVVFK
jgi:hypothetical protein